MFFILNRNLGKLIWRCLHIVVKLISKFVNSSVWQVIRVQGRFCKFPRIFYLMRMDILNFLWWFNFSSLILSSICSNIFICRSDSKGTLPYVEPLNKVLLLSVSSFFVKGTTWHIHQWVGWFWDLCIWPSPVVLF